MKTPFVVTPEAKSDLKAILLDIAEDSIETALRIQEEFRDEFIKLAHSPGIGHYHDELLSRKYRFKNFYRYVIVYSWKSRPLQIIAIVHGARDLERLFSLRPTP